METVCGIRSVETGTNGAKKRTCSSGTRERQITICRDTSGGLSRTPDNGDHPEGDTSGGLSRTPDKGDHPEATNGGVVQAQGVTGSRFYNGAAPGVTHPTGTGNNLHASYPLLCSALPGGKHRGWEIREAKAPAKAREALGEIGKTSAKSLLASPATSNFAPPGLGVEVSPLKTTSLNIYEKRIKVFGRKKGG